MSYKTTKWPWLIDEKPAEAKAEIKGALEANEWNVTRAAKALGLTRVTLWRFMKKLDYKPAQVQMGRPVEKPAKRARR